MLMKYVLGIRVCEIICLNTQDISFAINSWISAKNMEKCLTMKSRGLDDETRIIISKLSFYKNF